jgi:TRAP-type mannitol/chloroaromatic compound transport system substrate-binding protein
MRRPGLSFIIYHRIGIGFISKTDSLDKKGGENRRVHETEPEGQIVSMVEFFETWNQKKNAERRLSMKKFVTLGLVSSCLVVMAICLSASMPAPAGAAATAGTTITWKMQTGWPAGSSTHIGSVGLAKRIEEMSGGRIKIDIMPAGAIVPPFEILSAVHKGTLDAGRAYSAHWAGKHPAANLFATGPGGPFGMDSVDIVAWLYHGGGLELYRELYLEQLKMKVLVFPVDMKWPEPFGWFKKPFKSLADLKGLKMRESGLVAEVYKEAGITVIMMPGGEVLPALERGVLDAAGFSCPTTDKEMGFMDVCKYYYAPGTANPAGLTEFLLNKDVWDKLPADLKAIIDVATRDFLMRQYVHMVNQNVADLELLKTKYGVKVMETPKEVLLAILKAWDKVAAKYSKENPFFAKVYNSQKDYAKKIVQFRRGFHIPYEVCADYYWPKEKK